MIAPVKHNEPLERRESPRDRNRIVRADHLAESCRTLLRKLPWKGNDLDTPLTAIGLTSCHTGEGVTTIARELSETAAATGEHKILLADFNFNTEHNFTTDRSRPNLGVADVLLRNASWKDAVVNTDVPGLSYMPAGHLRDNANDAIDARCLPDLIEELKTKFDLVIADLPPAGEVSSVLRIGRLLDGLVIVVESEKTRREVVARLKSQLDCARINMLGVVLNRRHQHLPNWLYNLF